MQLKEKERIAREVAANIPDGSSLFIDIGTTTEAIAGPCSTTGSCAWSPTT